MHKLIEAKTSTIKTFLLLAASSASFTKAVPSAVTCCKGVKKEKMSKDDPPPQKKQKKNTLDGLNSINKIQVSTCLKMFETGSKPRGILEKSLNILDKSST